MILPCSIVHHAELVIESLYLTYELSSIDQTEKLNTKAFSWCVIELDGSPKHSPKYDASCSLVWRNPSQQHLILGGTRRMCHCRLHEEAGIPCKHSNSHPIYMNSPQSTCLTRLVRCGRLQSDRLELIHVLLGPIALCTFRDPTELLYTCTCKHVSVYACVIFMQ